jgi:enoyl-CoA hydratase/carnithine racemase
LELHLVDELADPGQALPAALVIAAGFASAAPLSVALTRAAYAKGCATLEDALRLEVDLQPGLYMTHDHQDAVSAFLEKKPAPPFRGL